MKVSINFKTDGVIDFYNIFNTKNILKKKDIVNLFDKYSYEKLLELFGKNVDLIEKDQWINLFHKAYILYLNNSKENVEENPVKSSIIQSVLWTLNNIENLNKNVDRIEKIINRQAFIKETLKYLPNINSDIEINIELYVFMYNACVEKSVVLLDVSFATLLTEDQLNALLSHELHHYLKENCQKPKKGYNEVGKALFALENEGIADMCSFKDICFIYEYFGFMEKGILKDCLENPDRYMREFIKLLRDKLILNKDIKLNNFLMTNQIVHPLGYSIAKYIENTFGIDELRNCAGKPLNFLLKYNDAVKKNLHKELLDQETIQKLKEIYDENI
ncbi:DUF5700 domain-containing putative Zn-dependent protease [Senegalia massiliensis]|uniref:Uncharacterized protein n=1 Tax=Senegalia massiliensis TaxID=1720316 RepID=A0A845QW76_9CLOT|nr:DUF5700 domain-containing putative Zn-dependent protease [Senegalia massiliensis]NBI05408.1 hypothetical protein [Senegalia massiliensis]